MEHLVGEGPESVRALDEIRGSSPKVMRVFDRMLDLSGIVAGFLTVFVMLIVVLDVSLRYFFNNPQEWVFETTEYSLVWFTFLAAPWVLKQDGHVKVDILFEHFSSRTQALLNVLTSVIGAIACLTIGYYGVVITLDFIQRGVFQQTALELPTWVVTWVIPVGCFLLFVEFLRRACANLSRLRTLDSLPQPGPGGG